jgi:hypothetical protein
MPLVLCRNLPDALREQLSELLGQAESGPPAEYARLEAQVKDKALRALEGQLFRPLQASHVYCWCCTADAVLLVLLVLLVMYCCCLLVMYCCCLLGMYNQYDGHGEAWLPLAA